MLDTPRLLRAAVVLGVLLAALNVRPLVSSVGVMLPELRANLEMSATSAGVLTALPVLCFALVGPTLIAFQRRWRSESIIAAAMVAITVGLALRAIASSTVWFMAASLVALAGVALANVIVPGLAKAHFPGAPGATLTGLYGTLTFVGLAMGSALTVPVGSWLGGWREGLAVWAVFPVLGAAPWLAVMRTPRRPAADDEIPTPVPAWRTRLGWVLALFFALQSSQAYVLIGWLPEILRGNGYRADSAGMLTALMSLLGVPAALLVSWSTRRWSDQRWLVALFMGCYVLGYLGLLLVPGDLAALLWVVLLGLGQGAFPLTLVLINIRGDTPAGAHALSAFVQSFGYLLAALVPIGIGLLFSRNGSSTTALIVMFVLVFPQAWFGWFAARCPARAGVRR